MGRSRLMIFESQASVFSNIDTQLSELGGKLRPGTDAGPILNLSKYLLIFQARYSFRWFVLNDSALNKLRLYL
jgi:hypothetical protein